MVQMVLKTVAKCMTQQLSCHWIILLRRTSNDQLSARMFNCHPVGQVKILAIWDDLPLKYVGEVPLKLEIHIFFTKLWTMGPLPTSA